MSLQRLLALSTATLLLVACGGDSGTDQTTVTPASMAIATAAPESAPVASDVDLAVRITDKAGRPVPAVSVVWSIVSGGGAVPTTATTGDDGIARIHWTLGSLVGAQSARASSRGLTTIVFSTTATPGALDTIRVSPASATLAPGRTAQLAVTRKDRYGNDITGPGVVWSSTDEAVARVSTAGLVTAVDTGTATIRASDGARSADVAITVVVPPSIAQLAPALLEPGVVAEVTGTDFGADAASSEVRVAGVVAAILDASPTRIAFRVPDRALLPCQAEGLVPVTVGKSGIADTLAHPLRVGLRKALAVGESFRGMAAGDLACTELAAGGGRYIVTVFNTDSIAARSAGFQARFLNAGAIPSGAIAGAAAISGPRPDLLPAGSAEAERHRQLLQRDLELYARLGPPPRRPSAAAAIVSAAVPTHVGDTVTLNVPDLNGNLCTTKTRVTARVVQYGEHAVILEDTLAPFAGTMDSMYQAIAADFESHMWPVVNGYFGNPLAFDAQTDANGRLVMLFSPVINNFGNVAGFVSTGDLYPRSLCAASNVGEVFYAIVPNAADGSTTGWTRGAWYKRVRAITVHEVKHLASFAERFSRSAQELEASWLEESTAQLAIEYWARAVNGYVPRGNTTYLQSLYCEYHSFDSCAGTSYSVALGFEWLVDYYKAPGTLSPIMGSRTSGFGSVYGSGWLFLRWLLDSYGGDDGSVTRALTQEPQLAGIANLESKTGHRFDQLIGDFLLAVALDDYPGLSATDPALTIPSWDTRAIFKGYYDDFHTQLPDFIPTPYPLLLKAVPQGAAQTMPAATLIGGGGAFFDLGGSASTSQMVNITAADGGLAAGTIGVAIARVQ